MTGPKASGTRPISVDSLLITYSKANGLAGPVQYDARPLAGEDGQPISTRFSKKHSLFSDSQESIESNGPRLVSRAPIQRDLPWFLAWFFDVIITFIPLLFLGMTAAFVFVLLWRFSLANGLALISYCSSRPPVRPRASIRLGRKSLRGEPPGAHTISHRLCCNLWSIFPESFAMAPRTT